MLQGETLANHKYLIPLGYLAFVGLPILITIGVVFSLSGKKSAPETEDDKPQVSKGDSKTAASNVPKKTPKRGPPPRSSPDVQVEPVNGGGSANENNAKKEPISAPNTPSKPEPKPTKVEPTAPAKTAPMPSAKKEPAPSPMRDPNALEIAPTPHEILWKLPLSGYESDWKSVGAVAVRIGGLAIAKAPLIDGKKNLVESQTPFLVVVMEVRKNESKEKRTLLSWTYFNDHYSSMFLKDDKELPNGRLPPGSKLRTKVSDMQVVPEDGSNVQDILLFAVPTDDAGELNLRLDAERMEEKGDIWFKIPALAWKKQ